MPENIIKIFSLIERFEDMNIHEKNANKIGAECYAFTESENILACCFSDFFVILRKNVSHDDIYAT